VVARVKEGYKKTEVGVIPEDWEVKQLDEVCLKIQDGTHFSPTLGGNDYLYITSKNLGYGILDTSNAECIDAIQHKAIFQRCDVRKGDLLLTKDGANTGNAALNHLDEEFSLLSSVAFLRFDIRKYDPAYYLQQILTVAGQKRIKDQMVGNAITRITLEKIRKLKFPSPPTLLEQTAIGEALSDMDGLISSIKKLIAKKQNIKQGALQELLTGRKRLSGFGGEWDVKTMDELFNFSGGFSASREQLSKDGYCYLHYGDIHGANKTFINVDREYISIPKLDIPLNKITKDKMLEHGDAVFVDASEDDEGTSKHIIVCNPKNIPYISGLHTIVSKSKDKTLSNEYKQFCFCSRDVKKQFKFYAVGTKVSGISRSNIAKIVITLPPSIKEQTAIAKILSDMDEEIEILTTKLNKYKAIKQGMMQELLTGKRRLV